jgi:hypothetical protein
LSPCACLILTCLLSLEVALRVKHLSVIWLSLYI